jgi:hypothetical protein
LFIDEKGFLVLIVLRTCLHPTDDNMIVNAARVEVRTCVARRIPVLPEAGSGIGFKKVICGRPVTAP